MIAQLNDSRVNSMSFFHRVYFGFYFILSDTKGAKAKSSGAWWFATITTINYLVSLYFVVGNFLGESLLPHEFPNNVVMIVVVIAFTFLASGANNDSWFGANVGELPDTISEQHRKKCKTTSILYVAFGIVLLYSTIALVFV